ncbi:GntR family transcriptional regulator [Faecalibacillus intestinalis]|uniref:GntR family transcriptional regulator n=1 Tax=Faecalibacillus intestinalis TaxID=1982626 RepID=UPI002FDA12DE
MKKNILENAGHGSLGHRIFCILRDKILNEEYEKGQKLNEVVLSKELNISRTPIREALKQLELEGLVKSISRTPIREALKQLELEGLVKSIPNKRSLCIRFFIKRY